MMAKLLEANTRLDAWMQGVEHLLKHERVLNLILAIESPTRGGSNTTIDQFLANEDQSPMHTVAETLFPGVEYTRRGLPGVLDFYPEEVYPAIEKHPSLQWGTYAYRLGPVNTISLVVLSFVNGTYGSSVRLHCELLATATR